MNARVEEFRRSAAFADYNQLLDDVGEITPRPDYGLSDAYEPRFLANVELLIRYGPFHKVGKGSSRTAYTFDADPRFVLKFAHNDNGLKQNQTGLRNVMSGDYACLVGVSHHDHDGIFIVEDFHRQSTYADWYRIVGISPHMLAQIIRAAFGRYVWNKEHVLASLLADLRNPRAAAEILKKRTPMDVDFTMSDHPKIIACIEGIVAAAQGETTEEKCRLLADLFRFYRENGFARMILEELLYTDQWGVKTDGEPDNDALIIIDPGVDEDFAPYAGCDGRIQ